MKWVTVVLSFALVCCQYSLWFGKGSIGRNSSLREQIAVQEEKNQTLALRNHSLAAEVYDLENGQEAISEIARVELGYIQDGFYFNKLSDSPSSSPAKPQSSLTSPSTQQQHGSISSRPKKAKGGSR